MNDDELFDELGDALDLPIPDAPADRIAAVRAAALRQRAAGSGIGPVTAADRHQSSRRSIVLGGAAAAVGAVVGVVGANLARDDSSTADPAPPYESITFVRGTAAGQAELSGKVINHTWGVELLLDATGLPVGAAYRVVYLDTDDALVEAGGFVGAELPIVCRCNAALLRNRIRAIEVRSSDDELVARADFA